MEPIGRLDIVASLSKRALDYYAGIRTQRFDPLRPAAGARGSMTLEVTSGTQSPTLGMPIAMASIAADADVHAPPRVTAAVEDAAVADDHVVAFGRLRRGRGTGEQGQAGDGEVGLLAEERQGEGAGRDVLADGEVARLEAELVGDVGLEVDGGEVVVAPDPRLAERVHDGVAVTWGEEVVQADDEDEPAHVEVILHGRQDEVAVRHQPLDVPVRHVAAALENLVEPLDLRDAKGGVPLPHLTYEGDLDLGA